MTRHGAFYFLARLGVGLLSAATLAVLTRLLTPEEYGIYALCVTTASIASAVLFQWLTVAAGRFYPGFADRPGVLVAASRKGFLGATLAAVLLSLVAVAAGPMLEISVQLVGGVLLTTLALGRYNFLLQIANVQGRPLAYVLLSWVRGATALGVSVAIILLGARNTGALLGFAVGTVVAAMAVNPLRGVRSIRSDEAKAISPKLLRYGLPLMLFSVGSTAVDYADRILIGWQLGADRVGPYSAGYDLVAQTIGAISNILFLAAFPAVLRAYETDGDDGASIRMQSLGRAFLLVGLPAATGFAVLSPDIAAFMLGPLFRDESARLMPILAAAIWMSGFKTFYLDVVFQVRQETGHLAWIALVMMVVNVGLNLLLLPVMGTSGAAWATLVALSSGAALSLVIGRSLMRLSPIRGDAFRALMACSIMAAPLVAMGSRSGAAWLFGKVALGVAVYAVAALTTDVGGVRAWAQQRVAKRAGRN